MIYINFLSPSLETEHNLFCFGALCSIAGTAISNFDGEIALLKEDTVANIKTVFLIP